MARFARKLILKSIVHVGLPVALVGGAYGWLAKSKLDAKLAPDGVKDSTVASFTFVDRAQSKVPTGLSRVLRVAVKRKDAPNWRPYGQELVHGVYDWSPSGSAWLDVEPTLEEARESLKLRALEEETPSQHIDALNDKSQHVREIASSLLRTRTGQDFDYRYDRPPETQKESIEKWRAWWEKNKLTWIAGKVLEGVGEILKK